MFVQSEKFVETHGGVKSDDDKDPHDGYKIKTTTIKQATGVLSQYKINLAELFLSLIVTDE